MSQFETEYLELVSDVICSGEKRETRAGPTRQVFGAGITIACMRAGLFPILTTRQIFYKPVLGELAAFLRGATDLQTFKNFGCNYWDANAAAWEMNRHVDRVDQSVGRIYGSKWRCWGDQEIDQIAQLVHSIKHDPQSRRHLLTAYDPGETWQCLPPCHLLAQFNVSGPHIDCLVYMRSVDLCLGLPADIILYATLLILICHETGYKPGTLSFMLGDTHIYENHVPIFLSQRDARQFHPPTWHYRADTGLDAFEPQDLELLNYQHGEKLVYPFAV